MAYRRPHPVKDPRLAARRLLEARTVLITLVLPPGAVDGALAVRISNAIETLEAAAENYGAIRELEPPAPAPDVTPEELDAVRELVGDRRAEAGADAGALDVSCPDCRAPIGSRCSRDDGTFRPPHMSRLLRFVG